MRKVFETFLKEHDVYDEFMSRACASLGNEELNEMFSKDPPCNWVISAFDWDKGLEDVRKWSTLSTLWETLCGSSQ